MHKHIVVFFFLFLAVWFLLFNIQNAVVFVFCVTKVTWIASPSFFLQGDLSSSWASCVTLLICSIRATASWPDVKTLEVESKMQLLWNKNRKLLGLLSKLDEVHHILIVQYDDILLTSVWRKLITLKNNHSFLGIFWYSLILFFSAA